MPPIPEWAVDVASALLHAVKLKDTYTFYHCCRVGRKARLLARSMGLDEYQQTILEFSGLFHDIGKVGIADNVLLKPGRLDDEEMNLIKEHPRMSAEIIEKFVDERFFQLLLPGIRCHHEKFDGSGYPFNIEGERIPLAARIIAVVDAMDAMTHTRTYRQALSISEAKRELLNYSGSQFDKNIVRIYLDAERYWEFTEPEEKEEAVIGQVLRVA